jgi:hypothetical protein
VLIVQAADVNDVVPGAASWLKGVALEKWNAIWPLLELTRINPEIHGDIAAMYPTPISAKRLRKRGPERAPRSNHDGASQHRLRANDDLAKVIGLRPDALKYPLKRFGASSFVCLVRGREGCYRERPSSSSCSRRPSGSSYAQNRRRPALAPAIWRAMRPINGSRASWYSCRYLLPTL